MQEWKIKRMKAIYNYCFICQKRNGSWYWQCDKFGWSGGPRHGNGKPVYPHKQREYKTWKYNRKTQWK